MAYPLAQKNTRKRTGNCRTLAPTHSSVHSALLQKQSFKEGHSTFRWPQSSMQLSLLHQTAV
jgi:hypothetical protein